MKTSAVAFHDQDEAAVKAAIEKLKAVVDHWADYHYAETDSDRPLDDAINELIDAVAERTRNGYAALTEASERAECG